MKQRTRPLRLSAARGRLSLMANVRLTMKTISEQKFEQFCTENSIPWKRLPTGVEATPDYEIGICGVSVIVEVKELTPNEDEKRALREMEEEHSTTWGGTVGQRVRYKIDSSKRQIESLCRNTCPGILLLYDARPTLLRGITPYEIEVAMYGFEAIDLHVPKDPKESVRFGTHRFGKGKKLRHDSHTYISALGVLREVNPQKTLHMDLYHNIHAEKPLPIKSLVQRSDISIFTVAPGKGNEFRGWAQIVSDEEYRKANKAIEAIGDPGSPQPHG